MTKIRALMKTGMFLTVLGAVVILSGCGSNPVSSNDPGQGGTYVPPSHAGTKGDGALDAGGGASQN